MQTTVTVSDSKGDVLSYPKVIGALPFSDSDDTTGYRNDYMLGCSGGVGAAGQVRCAGSRGRLAGGGCCG